MHFHNISITFIKEIILTDCYILILEHNSNTILYYTSCLIFQKIEIKLLKVPITLK